MKITYCICSLALAALMLPLPGCKSQESSLSKIPGSASLQDERLQVVRDTIQSWIDQGLIPSMSVGVLYRGQVIWLEALGLADIRQKVAATPQTIYPLGSMSKSISATGVMTLVDSGRLDLEASVNAEISPAKLKSFRWPADSVKVWHILNSAAGIPHGWTSFNTPTEYPSTDAEKDRLLEHYGIITLPPGKHFYYSNYSFGVADLIMERVSGLPLEVYLQQALFQPLEMPNTHSTYFPDLNAPYAMTYHRDLSEAGRLNSIPYGGLGYYSSAEDLLHYARMHLKQMPDKSSPLSQGAIDLMHDFPQSSADRFGLGWHNMGHALVSNGSVTGANSNLTLVPEHQLAIVCLTNVTSFNGYADQAAERILDLLIPDLEKVITYEKYVAEYETPYQLNPQLAGSWLGTIKAHQEDLPIRLQFPENGTVRLQIGAEAPQLLENVIFNRHQELNAQFSGKIPLPQYDGEQPLRYELVLYPEGENLVGHVAAGFSNERGGFRYGVFVWLERG